MTKAEKFVNDFMQVFDENGLGAPEKVMYLRAYQELEILKGLKANNLDIPVVSQRSELFSLAEMKQAFEAGEEHKYECYADSKERKCYCRNDDDCTWRKYLTFEDWIKAKENCG